MKVEKRSSTPHPEGWFLFLLGKPERVQAEWDGKVKARLQWPCISTTVQDEENNDLIVNLFTGVGLTDHPADKHRALVEDGFGIKWKDYDDTNQIEGQYFAGKVEKDAKSGKHNIVAFDTKERVRPKDKPKDKPKGRVHGDPFESE